jgi:MFS transporter, FSR family, fosmidomycin resistance protein
MRRDLGLGYAQIGLLLGVPGVLAAVVEPVLGLFGDAGRRRLIVVGGGLAFAIALVLVALAPGFAWLLLCFVVIWSASGAFVSLSQASLMDLEPERHEANMARWTFAGSAGAVVGPLVLVLALALGAGWRAVYVLCAALMLPLVLGAGRARFATAAHETFAAALRGALAAIRRPEVMRWLLLVQATELVWNVLVGYLALYFVDVVGLPPVAAGTVVVAWALSSLAGDGLLLLILTRVSGLTWLRVSAVLALLAYPALLLVPGAAAKVVLLGVVGVLQAGWYAIPQGRLFTALRGTAGTAIALSSAAAALGALVPLAAGALAERAGLQAALWIPILAPVALLALARSSERRQ